MYHKNFVLIFLVSIIVCNSMEAMKRSRSQDGSTEPSENESKKKRFQCQRQNCKFETHKISQYISHGLFHETHNGCYQCIKCHYLNTHKGCLEKHIQTMHSTNSSSSSSTMIKKIVPQEYKAKCHYCNLHVSNLKEHLKNNHKYRNYSSYSLDKTLQKPKQPIVIYYSSSEFE